MLCPCLAETLDWEVNVDPDFKERWWHECEVLREGEWGRVVRLFYHIFYGEGLVLQPGHEYTREPDNRPHAGVCVTVGMRQGFTDMGGMYELFCHDVIMWFKH